MVGRYTIAYKNLNKMRKKIKLVIVIIYFNLLSVHVEVFFAPLARAETGTCHTFTQCCFDCDRTTRISCSNAILKFYLVLFFFITGILIF